MVCNRAVADASAHSRAMVSSHSFPGRRFIRKPMEVCRLCHSLRCTGSIASPRVARPSNSGAGDEADRVSSSRRVGRGAFVGAIGRRCRTHRGVCRVALGPGVAANGAHGSIQVSGRWTVRTRLEAGGAFAGLRISDLPAGTRLHRGPTTGAARRAWSCVLGCAAEVRAPVRTPSGHGLRGDIQTRANLWTTKPRRTPRTIQTPRPTPRARVKDPA